jgi:hypothetical protein
MILSLMSLNRAGIVLLKSIVKETLLPAQWVESPQLFNDKNGSK